MHTTYVSTLPKVPFTYIYRYTATTTTITAASKPGATTTISYRHTFEENGEYLLKVVIDRGNLVTESNENNNVAEYLLIVDEPEKEDMIQSIIDNITGGGTTSMLLLVSVTSIILAILFINRNKAVNDFEWEEDDEF